jgi:hypothetical protein
MPTLVNDAIAVVLFTKDIFEMLSFCERSGALILPVAK